MEKVDICLGVSLKPFSHQVDDSYSYKDYEIINSEEKIKISKLKRGG